MDVVLKTMEGLLCNNSFVINELWRLVSTNDENVILMNN
jgi:hypothetical protein